jgi:hypothetical protein
MSTIPACSPEPLVALLREQVRPEVIEILTCGLGPGHAEVVHTQVPVLLQNRVQPSYVILDGARACALHSGCMRSKDHLLAAVLSFYLVTIDVQLNKGLSSYSSMGRGVAWFVTSAVTLGGPWVSACRDMVIWMIDHNVRTIPDEVHLQHLAAALLTPRGGPLPAPPWWMINVLAPEDKAQWERLIERSLRA